jgi:transcriptional antiterminator Rof (Rho-off)
VNIYSYDSGVSLLNEYQPIACALHEQYQYAVIKKHRLDLLWVDVMGERFRAVVMPKDVFTRSKEEYLRAEINADETIEIRLDRIQAAYWAEGGIALGQARN